MRRAHDHRARQRRSTRRSRPVMLASTIGQPAGLPTPHATTGRRDRRRPTRRARDRGDRKAHAMNGRVAKHAFATRPGDADTWVRMREAPISRESKAGLFTARLTIDDTPGQCGRIKVTTLQRGQIVADMLRELRARGFSYKRRLAMNVIAAAGRRSNDATASTRVELDWLGKRISIGFASDGSSKRGSSIASGGSSASRRASSSLSCAGRRTTSARSSLASTSYAQLRWVNPTRRCHSSVPAGTFCCGPTAGRRSIRLCRRSARSKSAASIPTTQRRTLGGTSTIA